MLVSTLTFGTLALLVWPSLVFAAVNITIDDFQRDLITYSPASEWRATSDSATPDRYLQTTTYTRTQGSFCSFTFTGTAIYYVGYGEITDNLTSLIRIELDNSPSDVPSSLGANVRPAQQILFARTGLAFQPHTIVIRKTSPSGGRDVNIDAFVYTVPDSTGAPPPDGSPSSPNSVKGPAATSTAVVASDTTNATTISIGGIVGGILGGIIFGALLVIGTLIFMRRRKAAKKAAASSIQPYVIGGTSPRSDPGSLVSGGTGYRRPMTMMSNGSSIPQQPFEQQQPFGQQAYGQQPYGQQQPFQQPFQPLLQQSSEVLGPQMFQAPSSGSFSYRPEPYRPAPQAADSAPWASPVTPPPGGSRKYVPPAFPGTEPVTQ